MKYLITFQSYFYQPIFNVQYFQFIQYSYFIYFLYIFDQFSFPTYYSFLSLILFSASIRVSKLRQNERFMVILQQKMDIKKSFRYGNCDTNSLPKSNKLIQNPMPTRKNLNESQNKSLQNQIVHQKQSQKVTAAQTEQNDDKNKALNKLKKPRQHKEGAVRLHQAYLLAAQSQKYLKNREESPNQKILSGKSRQHLFKHPQWLKSKKREQMEQGIPSGSKYAKQKYRTQSHQFDIYSTVTKNDISKIRSGSMAFMKLMEDNPWMEKSVKQIGGSNEDLTNRRYSKIQYMEVSNIKLEEQIKELKYKLQNLEEDKNILLGRIQTLQAQLSQSNKKIADFSVREDHHRQLQLKLRQKIEDLESKLIIVNNQVNIKNQLYDSCYNQGFSYTINHDREVVQKKNEQISRLNQIITKTRTKVNQLNHLLSQERINNLHNIKQIQQKFQLMMEKKQYHIRQLKKVVENRKQKASNAYVQSRRATDNQMLQRNQENLKRVVSAHFLHKDLPMVKFNN